MGRIGGSRAQLSGSTGRPASDLFINQEDHKLLVGLAQAVLLDNLVPGQPRGRDDRRVGHINSMIPLLAFFGAEILLALPPYPRSSMGM